MTTLESTDRILTEALEAMKSEYADWSKRVGEERKAFETSINALEKIHLIPSDSDSHDKTQSGQAKAKTQAAVKPDPTSSMDSESHARGRKETGVARLSISDDRLRAIIEFLETHPRVRQADIATSLGFNSGTVSVGLRVLRDQDKIREAGIESGSRLWETTPILVK